MAKFVSCSLVQILQDNEEFRKPTHYLFFQLRILTNPVTIASFQVHRQLTHHTISLFFLNNRALIHKNTSLVIYTDPQKNSSVIKKNIIMIFSHQVFAASLEYCPIILNHSLMSMLSHFSIISKKQKEKPPIKVIIVYQN